MINEIFSLLIEKQAFFLSLLMEHLFISLVSILIALGAGLVLGILISQYQKSSKYVLGFVNFIYTIPSISLLGFLIPFSGIGNTTAIIALTIYALLPMVRNTHTGITNIDEQIIEAAKGMGSTRSQILFKIKLPLAMPVIMSGLRNMATMTIALAGIASFIGAGGLGVAIYRGITTNNAAMTIAGSLLIALLAIIVDLLLGLVEKLTRRKASKKHRKSLVAVIAVLACVALIGGNVLGGAGDKTIQIATKPMTEQYILGEMLKELIEQDTDLEVTLTQGVGGGTSNIEPAIEKGDFDLYPEYTGTGWNMVLKNEGMYDESMFDQLKSSYEKDLKLTWSGMYGFNNTYGLAVRKEVADQYNLKTYSDLAKVSGTLTFGAEYDFYEREDGYEALCDAYGFHFEKTSDMDIGLKYKAINQGKVDVMTIFTTDGQLSVSDIVVLTDDKQFYPSYMCGNVVRKDTLEKHPELAAVLTSLDDILDDKTMADLNYQVEGKGKEPKNVAHAFLKAKGFVR